MDDHEFQELMRYQSMLSRQVVQEAKTDRKIKVLTIINQLSASGKKKLQTAAVLHEAEHQGMQEADIYDVLDELIKDRIVIEKDGYVQKT
jgi:hypothetical protein